MYLSAYIPQVRLYMDCEEYHRVAFTRSPQPLTFEASSGIFVGNAGGTGLPRFVVSWDGTGFTRVSVFTYFVSLHSVNQAHPPIMFGSINILGFPHYSLFCVVYWTFLESDALDQWAEDIESATSCRDKGGVWVVFYFTFETWTQ